MFKTNAWFSFGKRREIYQSSFCYKWGHVNNVLKAFPEKANYVAIC